MLVILLETIERENFAIAKYNIVPYQKLHQDGAIGSIHYVCKVLITSCVLSY